MYVQYGCGLDAPEKWLNFDASPTLRFERIPVLGSLYRKNAQRFPEGVRFGNIAKGLPVPDASCSGVYCSHVLEHMTRADAEAALRNTYRYLRHRGTFRLVVPDLRQMAAKYLADHSMDAAHTFMRDSYLGQEKPATGLMQRLSQLVGHGAHLWLWDEGTMKQALTAAGFVNVRRCEYGDASDPHFALVENPDRFKGALAMEAVKA